MRATENENGTLIAHVVQEYSHGETVWQELEKSIGETSFLPLIVLQSGLEV